MCKSDISDPIFLDAVNALNAGRLDTLRELVSRYPTLLLDRLPTPNEHGYFKDPYLIWFVADNPIRHPKLPENIVDITRFLIDAVKREAPDTYQHQIDYTLGLVATGRIPRECGVQILMMDALIDAGAKPGGAMWAIANGNLEAANHLIDRGGKLKLTSALLLNRKADIDHLIATADDAEKLTALTVAAFYGRVDIVKRLLDMGVNPNDYPDRDSGFHSHATPVHQAVSSTSLDTVKLLVDAGARLDLTDTVYHGTPLDWAIHLQTDTTSETEKEAYRRIEIYLREPGVKSRESRSGK